MTYCKDIANFLFWELWECLIIPIKIHSINLLEFFMLMCMQKINSITQFFLKILQRNSKLVILGTLGMPGYTPKMILTIWSKLLCLSAQKKTTCCFGYFRHAWLRTSKVIVSTCRKLWCLSVCQKKLRHSLLSRDTMLESCNLNDQHHFSP